ncbi:hypothetical protein CFC21_006983 [Triticum aestivum]|uniref:Uncharacterized protein n=2 Tax=Triticum aestivum TaxID=4565 RepID=A0A3B5YYM7_WHEAT|nr:fluoride export protein 1-like [Triticum aestivum]KAF6989680.1 hypothetical protein CFC21_006983 [Triticum aestivum]
MMEDSSTRSHVFEGNRLGYVRSESMDSAGHPSAARSGSLLSRRSSRPSSRGSISLSREMGDSILNSMRHSLQSADQLLGHADSSALAQVIDSGDRVLALEDEADEDMANTLDQHPVRDNRIHGYSSHGTGLPAPESSLEPKGESSSGKVEQYMLSRRLDYASYLIHLAAFGSFGVFTRYGLQKLFGPGCLALTSNQSPLYLDLPSNMLGSFLMAWFGIIFKTDIRHISEHLIVGITTGYMGSLTTFSGWNQAMVSMSSKDHWAYAIAGIVLGMFIVNESIRVGAETGERLRSWILKCIKENSSIGSNCNWEQLKVNTRTKHFVLIAVMMILLSFVWVLSIVLAIIKVRNLDDGAVLWLGCSVAPPGVWLRWYLARLNGQGIGKQRSLKWLPIGTLVANVLAAGIMASLAVTAKAVNTKRSTTVLNGIQFGFLGCLSTVSTFAAEIYAMRSSGQIGRAFVYAAATFVLSFVLGTLVYSVPVWVNHYQ